MTHSKLLQKYSKLSENVCVTLIQHYRKKIKSSKKYTKERIEATATAQSINMPR